MSLIGQILNQNGVTTTTPAPDTTGAGANAAATGTAEDGANGGADGTAGTEGAEGGSAAATPAATTPAPAAAQAGNEAGQAEDAEDDISEEKIIAALQKKGLKIDSIQALAAATQPAATKKEEEEDEEEDEVTEDAAHAYLLEQKLIDQDTIGKYKEESAKDKQELARLLHHQNRIAELKEAGTKEEDMPSEDELNREFEDLYYTFEDQTDPKYKHGQKMINRMVNEYLEDKYGVVIGAKETVKEEKTTQRMFNRFTKALDEVASEVGSKITISLEEDGQPFSYSYTVPTDVLEKVKAQYAVKESIDLFGKDGKIDKDSLKGVMQVALIGANFEQIVAEVAKSHTAAMLTKMGKGRRGIPDGSDAGASGKPVGGSSGKTKLIKKALQGAG